MADNATITMGLKLNGGLQYPPRGLRLALGFEIERHCSPSEKMDRKPVLPPTECSEINQDRDKSQSTEENDRENNRSGPESPRPRFPFSNLLYGVAE